MGFLNKVFKKKDKKAPRGFYNLKVQTITRQTPKAVSVTFEVPENLQNEFDFTPGQYVNLHFDLNGSEFRRSYSICSKKQKGSFSVAVKTIENGTVSQYVNNELKVGDEVFVTPPEGNFLLDQKDGSFLAIAAGSGITPIMSMVETIAEQRSDSQITLLYGNSNQEEIIFDDRLKALQQKDNVQIQHFLSQEDTSNSIHGRIDKTNLQSYLKNELSLLKSDAIYICGPEAMIVSSKTVLKDFGVNEDKIQFELFTTPVADDIDDGPKEAVADFDGEAEVKVILDDEEVTYQLQAEGNTILEATMDAGLDAPYSCQGGVCSTCKAKLLEGKVEMIQNFALTDGEVEEGYILTCQSQPKSEKLVVSYDE